MENAEKVSQTEDGGTYARKKRRVPKVFLAVAVFVLLIGCGCFGVLYYNSNKVELDENGKIDIYYLKGAKIDSEMPEMYTSSMSADSEPYPKDKYIMMLKRDIESSKTAVVYGTAKNVKSITVDDRVQFKRSVQTHLGDGSSKIEEREYDYPVIWWIVTFDIAIIDDLGTLDGRETVHVIMASRYATGSTGDDPNFKLHWPKDIKEMLAEIEKNPTGLYMLRNQVQQEDERLDDTWISNGNIWKVRGKEYRSTEFADYFVSTRFNCDGESFRYAYTWDIMLDEIRVQKEE